MKSLLKLLGTTNRDIVGGIVGGGKPKKPLSALDKQRKKALKIRKTTKEERKTLPTIINEQLIRKARRTVQGMDVVTPATLASALSVKVSVAKKLIKYLESEGSLKVIDRSRELIIAVPSKK